MPPWVWTLAFALPAYLLQVAHHEGSHGFVRRFIWGAEVKFWLYPNRSMPDGTVKFSLAFWKGGHMWARTRSKTPAGVQGPTDFKRGLSSGAPFISSYALFLTGTLVVVPTGHTWLDCAIRIVLTAAAIDFLKIVWLMFPGRDDDNLDANKMRAYWKLPRALAGAIVVILVAVAVGLTSWLHVPVLLGL